MKPAAFAYHRPATLAEAFALWEECGSEAAWLAGGQSLIPAMAMRLNQPGALIDLAGIAALRGIGVDVCLCTFRRPQVVETLASIAAPLT